MLCIRECLCACNFAAHAYLRMLVCPTQDFISDQFTYDLPLLSPLVSSPCDCQPAAVALSPYHFGEAVVIMETGEMRRWSGEK